MRTTDYERHIAEGMKIIGEYEEEEFWKERDRWGDLVV
jgi:hypothetical protein